LASYSSADDLYGYVQMLRPKAEADPKLCSKHERLYVDVFNG